LPKIPKCFIRDPAEKKCKEKVIATLKVYVIHSDTLRKTNQKWPVCEHHLERFVKTNGKGWFRWYAGKRKEKRAYVIDYMIIPTPHIYEISTQMKNLLENRKFLTQISFEGVI